MKGVTAADAAYGEPATSNRTMLLDRFYAIFRASGKEAAAMTKKWADRRLIKAYEKNNDYFHE